MYRYQYKGTSGSWQECSTSHSDPQKEPATHQRYLQQLFETSERLFGGRDLRMSPAARLVGPNGVEDMLM